MRVHAAALVCVLTAACALTSCGTDDRTSSARPGPPTATTSSDPVLLDKTPGRPPGIIVHSAGVDLTPRPGSYCWHTDTVGMCADMVAPAPTELPILASAGPATFDFPIAGWEFTATFTDFPDDPPAKHSQSVPLEQPTPGRFVVEAPAENGDFQVILIGTGPQGDTSASFRWQVTAALPEVVEWDGEGFAPPITLDLDRRQRNCYSEGSLSFMAPDDEGRRATGLGSGPFAYDVALTLDGTTYHGLGTWPDDDSEDIAPHVPLTWTPALPAYEG